MALNVGNSTCSSFRSEYHPGRAFSSLRGSLVDEVMEASVSQNFRRFLVSSWMAILTLRLTLVVAVSDQVIRADLVGTVLDKTGSGVPGATVEAVNSETGLKYHTRANENGAYRFNNL